VDSVDQQESQIVSLRSQEGARRPTGSQGGKASPNHMAKGVEEMKDLFTKVKSFVQEEDGASAVEYGLLVAGIAVVVMTAIYAIGTNLNTKYQAVATQLGG
jgi:pilus assembly protein Flp/PilA